MRHALTAVALALAVPSYTSASVALSRPAGDTTCSFIHAASQPLTNATGADAASPAAVDYYTWRLASGGAHDAGFSAPFFRVDVAGNAAQPDDGAGSGTHEQAGGEPSRFFYQVRACFPGCCTWRSMQPVPSLGKLLLAEGVETQCCPCFAHNRTRAHTRYAHTGVPRRTRLNPVLAAASVQCGTTSSLSGPPPQRRLPRGLHTAPVGRRAACMREWVQRARGVAATDARRHGRHVSLRRAG